jgi:D-glycero-D-manno-heptose 1,7-bisphosphate phosphatase
MTPAIFLDRDGTLVEPRHYPARPEDLVLWPGIGPRLRHLQQGGFRLVVITNQSGIARGYFDESDLDRMHDHLRSMLARDGVTLDAIEHCPHHPDGVVANLAITCACRKPAPGMILRAAERLGIDLTHSWFIGDILDDVEAGNRAGCRSLLVDLGTEHPPATEIRTPWAVCPTTADALDLIAAAVGNPALDRPGWPARWLGHSQPVARRSNP